MARKIKKKAAVQKTQEIKTAAPAKKECFFKKNKKLTVTLAAILLSALIIGIVFGVIALIKRGKEIDYLSADLSKYIYISSEDYKNYPVDIPLKSVDEDDVLREINKLLVKNKDKNALFGGASVRPLNYTIKLGDVVNIWYRGYSVDENGVKTEIPGADNFKSGVAEALEIGSGKFIDGFEEALIGKTLHEKSLKTVASGKVEPGDIIYISYSAFLADGTPTTVSDVVIDTADTVAVNKKYGKGFAEFFIGKMIGDKKGTTEAFRIEGENIDTLYYDIKVTSAVRTEGEPHIINVVFPADYGDKNLRGTEATFEVYASTAVLYNKLPEWNDTFVTETLKESAESLSAYEGETLTEKYENKIRHELENRSEEINKELIEEEMWEHYFSKLEIKKLPKWELDKAYSERLAELSEYYTFYGMGFESFDAFMRNYLGLSAEENWSDYIRAEAEVSVAKDLVFFYIIRNESLLPDSAEYDRLYAKIKGECFERFKQLYKTDIEACKTDEEKAAKLLEIEEKCYEHYGERYFREQACYEYAYDFLIGFANVK